MDIGSILLILALAILVSLVLSRPFFERRSLEPVSARQSADMYEHERSMLLAERERLLNALLELDFDYTLGKIPVEDYPAQRAALLQAGVSVLKRLDELQGASGGKDTEERLEAELASRRIEGSEKAMADSEGTPDDELEALIAARRRARQEKSVGFCPRCGGALYQSDRFCARCGTAVKR